MAKILSLEEAQNYIDNGVDQHLRAEVMECVERSIATIAPHFPETTFTIPEVIYDLVGTTAGQARKYRNENGDIAYQVRINPKVLLENREQYLRSTIPHETAHIAQYQAYGKSDHHGAEWQYMMHLLGLPAKRTHSYTVEKARKHQRYPVECSRCGREYGMTIIRLERMRSGETTYRCRSCKGKIVERTDA